MTYDASDIKILKGLEGVRKRPAMYIGSTDSSGMCHLVYEILDNSVDEASNGHGSNIYVSLNGDGSCTVRDEGRGIPVDMHESGVNALRVVLTTLHAGGKFDNSSYKASGGLHGVGSSVVNALSEWLDVKVARDGWVYIDRFEHGFPAIELDGGRAHRIGFADSTLARGTEITFKPDPSIFRDADFNSTDIKARMHEIAYLNPGLTLMFEDWRGGADECEVFHEPGGLVKFLSDLNADEPRVHAPCVFDGSYDGADGTIKVCAAFQYVQSFNEKIFGFCNNIRTRDGGSHMAAMRSQITTTINRYARELGKLNGIGDGFTGSDVRSGFTAIVSVMHPNPQFEGQTKTRLGNKDAYSAVSAVCASGFQNFFDSNSGTLNKIISIARKSAKLRIGESMARGNAFNQKRRFSFDANGKLANCSSRDASKCELFIVEGDSAAGSSKMARDREYQAVLPIRGKILNAEKAQMGKILANAEVRSIIYALNCGSPDGGDFDLSKLRYGKIIINSDSDVDGDHITTLLMTLFYRLMPGIIRGGHLYKAVSPLYKAIPAKGDVEYLYSDDGLTAYRRSHSNFHLQRYKGLGEMTPDQLWDTTMNPETRVIRRLTIGDESLASKATADLMGADVQARKRFIRDNARAASIDV